MKVQITAETKKSISAAQLPAARAIVKSCAEDENGAKEYAASAVNAALKATTGAVNGCVKVLEASACVARNCRAWCNYDDNSENLDVWIKASAETVEGFIKIGAYLTDIWQLSGDNDAAIVADMYVRRFVEA